MGGADREEDRTFAVSFSVDGAAKLRKTLKDKLKELMGDYTDDTLVEYVIVLLKNGRHKEEARNELNVFLGDDSDSFVTWLWDHLQSNLDLYVQAQESVSDVAPKTEPTHRKQGGINDSRHMCSDTERGGESDKLSRRRHNKEWKDLAKDVDEPPPLRSSVIDRVHAEESSHRSVVHGKRFVSPQPVIQKKRQRSDERKEAKRVRTVVDAPRRLLQFAVRDAVTTPRPSNSSTEPALKRLHSVVSTSAGDSSLEDHPRRTRIIGRVSNVMAIKAVEEAAKDVMRKRSSGNVFDRLGCSADVSQDHSQVQECREAVVEDVEDDSTNFKKSRYSGKFVGNTKLESDTDVAYDLASDNEGYDDVNDVDHRVKDASLTDTSAENKDDSLMVQYSIAKNADEVTRKPHKDQDQPSPIASTSVNISVNVNTWEPSHYQQPWVVPDINNRKSVPGSDAGPTKSGVRLREENDSPITVGNGNVKLVASTQKVSQKPLSTTTPGTYAAGRPTEDADSRIVFVSNVHFAATKDTLSRHFNKFGEVLKVVIVTDAATGQPKGSAYVEFMRKESAENALSLDGTSFMSRILKVVKKGPAHQEAVPIMTWPRIPRGSPSGGARFPRVPFPRGVSGAYRAWPPVKPGARSLQWKRDAQPNITDGASLSVTGVPPHAGRSLTYVRTEPKSEGNPSAA